MMKFVRARLRTSYGAQPQRLSSTLSTIICSVRWAIISVFGMEATIFQLSVLAQNFTFIIVVMYGRPSEG